MLGAFKHKYTLCCKASAQLLAVLMLLSFAGCDKPASSSSTTASAADEKPGTNAATDQAAAPAPAKDEKRCFGCDGVGTIPCRAAGCAGGKTDCPGACLKLSQGPWIHMNVPGHSPTELWRKFPDAGGRGGYQAWNQNHVGEVVVMQNGKAVNIGACKICGGTTKVECRACKGAGKQLCETCNGKRFVPVAWTPTNNPWLNSQPDLIRLKDGRVLLGKVALKSGGKCAIRLRDGKFIDVEESDVVSSGETGSSAAH